MHTLVIIIRPSCSASNFQFDLGRSSCTSGHPPSSFMGQTSEHMRHRSLVSATRPGRCSTRSHPWITTSFLTRRESGSSTTPPPFAGSLTTLWPCSGCPRWTTCCSPWPCPCRRRTAWGGRAWPPCFICSLTAMYHQTETDTSRSSWSTSRCGSLRCLPRRGVAVSRWCLIYLDYHWWFVSSGRIQFFNYSNKVQSSPVIVLQCCSVAVKAVKGSSQRADCDIAKKA